MSLSSESPITRGLIIKQPFIDRILAGTKTWELRSAATKQRGPIALIEQGTGMVVGIAELVDSLGPLTAIDMQANGDKHGVSPDRLASGAVDKYRHAWVLRAARRLHRPVPYQHKSGAVIWAALDPDAVAGIQRQV